ncbi:ead/Ea22-like family protein [Citrobacter freundii]|uniref:ead/Ea22-like family protein n=1 Tax=Citrobacter freundii TaxID=546 RepID=UPI003F9B5290
MTALNKQALREAAEKATAGQWVVELGDEVYAVDGDDSEQIAMVFSDNGRSDAAFIAAASPVAVLSLLDENASLRKRIAELEAKLETADKLQDSAFRHGLQHGFSYGQTNDQAGYEQCLNSYSSRGKDNG